MKALAGFTLFELLICLLISAVVLCWCLPLGSQLVQKNQIQVISEEIQTALRYARNMALIKGLPLALTPLPGKDNWAAGMILFVDNASHQFHQSDELIYQWQWHHPGIKIRWKGFRSPDYLLFASALSQSTLNGHFLIDSHYGVQKQLIVNRLGKIHAA